MSEIARLLSSDGKAVLSTDLDIYSEDALARFLYLAGTELIIEEVHLFYHGLFIRFYDLFSLFKPLKNWISKRDGLALFLEKLAKLYQTENDASAVVIVGKRKKVPEMT